MKVEVRFFGQLIDKLGLAVYQLEVSEQKFEDVRDDLEKAFPALKSMSYQLAQNNAIIEGETALDQSICFSTFWRMNSRYLRQQTLEEIDSKVKSNYLRVEYGYWTGGLGCPLLQILASTGVGYLTLVDFDRIATHNLARQMLFRNEDVGRYKTEVVAEYLKAYFPDCKVAYHTALFHENNASELIRNHDVVVDATDDIKLPNQ